MAKARAKGHVQVLEKLTEQVDGEPRIIEELPLIVRETHTVAGTPINVGPRPSCCGPISTRCQTTGGGCCRATASSTSPARSWASAASAPRAG